MSCRIICAAFPYLVVSGDDMGKRLTINDPLGIEESHPDDYCYFCKNLHSSCECRCHDDTPQEVIFPDCAMCAPCAKCDDECGCVPGPCWWCGHSRAEFVVEAIFGKPSGNVVWKGAGTI